MAIEAKSGVRQLRERAAAHVYAKRWRTESSDAKVIVVGGRYGKRTTALLLKHIFETQGEKVISHSTQLKNAEDVQKVLQRGRKQKAGVVILSIEDDILNTRPLGPVTASLLVVPSLGGTDDARTRRDLVSAKKYVYGLELGEYPLENPEDSNIAFGEGNRNDAVIKNSKLYRKGTELTLTIDHQTKLDLATYLIGKANIYNVAAAVSSVYVLHRSMDDITDLIADIELVEGNYESIDIPKAPFSVSIDSAPDEHTAKLVIESAISIAKRRLIVVVEASQMGEECIDELIGQVDRLIVVDVNDLKRDKSGVDRVVSPDSAFRKVVQVARQNDTVLLLGDSFVKRDDNGQPIAVASLTHAMESR